MFNDGSIVWWFHFWWFFVSDSTILNLGLRHPTIFDEIQQDKGIIMLVHSKGIEAAKSRMRSALESARSQFSGIPLEEDTSKEIKING